jgi:cytochrome P450 family 6
MNNMPMWMLSLFKIGITGGESSGYIRQVIEHAVKNRTINQKRRDLLQVLLEAKDEKAKETGKGLDDIELMANAIFFVGAAFDTTSTTSAFVSWLLALNPDKQEKIFDEIMTTLGEDKERDITYDDLTKMVYLEAAINETLRMYTVDVHGYRRPNVDVIVPGTDIHIPAHSEVRVPLAALHHDPEIFPEPEVFKPERFLPENKDKMQACSFMAFGEGPRKCVGQRLAYQNLKQGLAEVIRKYRFVRSSETIEKYIAPLSNMMIDSTPLFIKVEARR